MNEDFRYIAAIANHGSISKAARSECISQPALSQRLKRLEEKLGCELFDRSSQPLVPTQFGEVVIRYAQRAIAIEADMNREVHSMVRNKRRRLRVGVPMARADALLAGPIVEFHESFHSCTIEFVEIASLEQLQHSFLTDGVDFALLTPLTADSGHYDLKVLCHERLVVTISKNLELPHIDPTAKRVFLSQLEGIPLVIPACDRYFSTIIDYLIDTRSIQLDVIVRDCSASLALALVSDGIGATVVPSTYLMGHDSLRSFELGDIDTSNSLHYIRQQGKPTSNEETRFLQIVRKHIEQMM